MSKAPAPKKPSPFDVVKAIKLKQGKYEDFDPSLYNPYIINKSLSYDLKSLFQANEVNRQIPLPHKALFEFYINSIASKIGGYQPWAKPQKIEELPLICEFFEVSLDKGREILNLLSDAQIEIIINKVKDKDKTKCHMTKK